MTFEEYKDLIDKYSSSYYYGTFTFCNNNDKMNDLLKALNINSKCIEYISMSRFLIIDYEFANDKIIFYNKYRQTQHELYKEILNVYNINNMLLFEIKFCLDPEKNILVIFYLENKIDDFDLFKSRIKIQQLI